ncbi:MAG: N-acetylneuraminate synthase family protein [Candidatus Cloacimonetes bacterium]|nr:N-acetylneuraminate synthase family protein [Candidatus Cloacimonadota bacterium]
MKIADFDFNTRLEPYLLAEIGLNHNGSLDLAKKMIDVAKDSGAHGVKFQSFKASDLVLESEPAFEIFNNLALSIDEHQKLYEHCLKQDIHFLSTPFSLDWVDVLNEIGVPAFKVASGDMDYYDLVEKITETKKPLIVSSGMATASEIDDLMNQSFLKDYELILLHCISNYPPKLEDCHIRYIQTLDKKYKSLVGISDHSEGIAVSLGAVALGARFIEKHFTLDKSMDGPDQSMSMDPSEFKALSKASIDLSKSLGKFEKPVIKDEIQMREIARRGLYISEGIKSGDTLNHSNSRFVRPFNGLSSAKVRLSHDSHKWVGSDKNQLNPKDVVKS